MDARVFLAVAAVSGCACNLVHGPPRDGECRANLLTIANAEVGLYSEHQRYSEHPAELGFAPPPGNRYLYLFAPTGGVTRRDDQPSPPWATSVGIGPDTRSRGVTAEWLRERFPTEVLATLGVHGACPACEVVVGCAGNIDDDDAVDVWSLSTSDRTFADGGVAGHNTPYRHRDDRFER